MPSRLCAETRYHYGGFRRNRIRDPQYRHLLYLLFWPVFGIRYLLIENLHPAQSYHLIECSLDYRIPFQELFIIPYILWFALLAGMHIYTLRHDIPAFCRYSRMLILCIAISTAIFLLYPSQQNLRPAELPRDNVFSRAVGLLYEADTCTNVFPSEHALGSFVIFAASLHTKGLRSPVKTTVIGILTMLTCMSAVFLKQHSILDVIAAVPIAVFAYWICYRRKANAQTV